MSLLLALLLPFTTQTSPAPSQPPAITVTVNARSIQPGELAELTIRVPEGTEAVTVRAFDRAVQTFRIDERTWGALVGIDLATAVNTYPVVIKSHGHSGDSTLTQRLRVVARQFRTRRLQVDESFVNPPASELARIARENEEQAEIWKHSDDEPLWKGPFVRPVPGEANSAFGTRSYFNGQLRTAHSGGDFLSPAGTPIKAPAAGRVVLAKNLYFSGNTVIIDHGTGVFSLLAHMSVIDVKSGDRVNTGEIVGKVGATGRVTGPHLHWGVRVNGARVDPLSVLAVLGKS